MSVTFPLISNSVHRIRISFEAFAPRVRPTLKIPSVPSSRNGGPGLRLFLCSAALPRLRSHSLRSRGRVLVDACRRSRDWLGARNGSVPAEIGRQLEIFREIDDERLCEAVRPAQLEDFRDDHAASTGSPQSRDFAGRAHVDEAEKPDCDRRNRRSDAEGTDGLGEDSMAVAGIEADRRYDLANQTSDD